MVAKKQTLQHNQNTRKARERGSHLPFRSAPDQLISLEVVSMVTGSNVEAFQGVEAKGNMEPKTGDSPLRKHQQSTEKKE